MLSANVRAIRAHAASVAARRSLPTPTVSELVQDARELMRARPQLREWEALAEATRRHDARLVAARAQLTDSAEQALSVLLAPKCGGLL